MKREAWPTANGLPIAPSPECYEICPRRSPHHNLHHLAHERGHYKTSLERSYRNTGAMILTK